MPELFRPFRAPRGERRSGADRRGPIRAEDASDRRGTPRRAFERRAMPMGPGALVGRLLVEPEPELTCKVWDLGQGGTCVFIQQDVQLATNLPVRLELKCSYEAVIFPFSAVVAWTATEGVATFVGLAFADPVEGGPFYERYFIPYLQGQSG
ncbi:MAG: PilZ domain-containing protein [Cyanobacteriota bacterium]|jgi:hypothetical protein